MCVCVCGCVCVCKIKWQAECSASTNTGASARMKGAVTTAHGGKEEKYIHPRSSPLHLSPPLPMHLLWFCFSIHMGRIKKKKGNHCFSHPAPCGTFLQYICFPVLTTLFSFCHCPKWNATFRLQQMYRAKTFLRHIPRTNKVN